MKEKIQNSAQFPGHNVSVLKGLVLYVHSPSSSCLPLPLLNMQWESSSFDLTWHALGLLIHVYISLVWIDKNTLEILLLLRIPPLHFVPHLLYGHCIPHKGSTAKLSLWARKEIWGSMMGCWKGYEPTVLTVLLCSFSGHSSFLSFSIKCVKFVLCHSITFCYLFYLFHPSVLVILWRALGLEH